MEKLLHRTGFDPAADDYATFRPSLRDTEVKTQDKTDSPDTGRRRSVPRWLSPYKEKTMNLCRGLVAKMTHGNAIRAGKGETEVPEAGRSSLFKAKNTHTSVLNKVCNTELNRQVHEIADELGLECDIRQLSWDSPHSRFSFKMPAWKSFCIAFEFMSKDLRDLNYGIRYADERRKGRHEEQKARLLERMGGRSDPWWACFKPFDHKDWDNAGTFEKLFDGTVKRLMTERVKELLGRTSDMTL